MGQSAGIAKILSDNIRRLRNEANLGQETLAEKLDVSLPTIRAWENEARWPGIQNISDLAKFFKVSEAELFKEPGPNPTSIEVITQFAKLLSTADPQVVKQVLEILEVAQPGGSASRAPVPPKRIAKSSAS